MKLSSEDGDQPPQNGRRGAPQGHGAAPPLGPRAGTSLVHADNIPLRPFSDRWLNITL